MTPNPTNSLVQGFYSFHQHPFVNLVANDRSSSAPLLFWPHASDNSSDWTNVSRQTKPLFIIYLLLSTRQSFLFHGSLDGNQTICFWIFLPYELFKRCAFSKFINSYIQYIRLWLLKNAPYPHPSSECLKGAQNIMLFFQQQNKKQKHSTTGMYPSIICFINTAAMSR